MLKLFNYIQHYPPRAGIGKTLAEAFSGGICLGLVILLNYLMA
jgi:hypothetical protein